MPEVVSPTAVALLFAVLLSFTLSASAGLGGSLVLVPSLALLLGTKEGVALAALLLGANNVLKVIAYRRTLPFAAASGMVVLLAVGAAVGATALVRMSETVIGVAVIASFLFTLVAEVKGWQVVQRMTAGVLGFASGATSGFSGTSGPLKGAALRNLDLDRIHFVGGASLASLAGDLTKTAVFAEASLLSAASIPILVASLPLMAIGTFTGRRITTNIGRRGFAVLFWSVMVGYSARVVGTLM